MRLPARTTRSLQEARALPRRFPVIETFGPTIQGEGPDAGQPCQFIRFGGCDYRCSWCDSMYAVEPSQVRENSTWMTADQIRASLKETPRLVVLSGGNPVLMHAEPLVESLHAGGYALSIETQGSVWRPWLKELGSIDQIVVSPKPPSSGMATDKHEAQTRRFMEEVAWVDAKVAVKIVVFDERDYEWAMAFNDRYMLPMYLSAGTTQGLDEAPTKHQVLLRYEWLAGKLAGDARGQKIRALPQLHVLAFGTGRGV